MNDESIMGLLLRALEKVAAQKHGEEFIFHNVSAMCAYEQALQSIHSAIQSVSRAESHVYADKKPRD